MTSTSIFILLALLPLSSAADDKPKWNYDKGPYGPDNWHTSYVHCKHENQSPIDIRLEDVKYEMNPDFKFNDAYYERQLGQFTMVNNGHTITINVNEDAAKKELTEGGLVNTFQLLQFHLHWGVHDGEGSEHSIDGKNSSMELHLVHMDITRFKDFNKAVHEDKGLAVLGVMLEIGKNPHPGFQKLVDVLDKVKYKGQSTPLTSELSVTELLPCSTDMYFRYIGSLTTPPCSESVIWTLFKEHLKISHEQMVKFRSMMFSAENETEKRMVGNHRPLQSINTRRVTRSFLSAQDFNAACILIPITPLLLLLTFILPILQ